MWWGAEGAEATMEAIESTSEMEDMKEQFDMQQNLIKQLKDMVKTHQNQLQEKEHQVQKLSAEQTSRLASLSRQVAALEEDTPANKSTASVSGSQGRRDRMLEIKRQLEEQRRMQEERVQERRVGLEAMVRNLQARIEDEEYRYDSCDSADSGSDGEADYGSSLRKSVTLSDSVRGKEPEELYGVILTKDNRIYELLDKVSQLEATVIDLKETLQEKESVISARTAAVGLVTEALTERGRGTLESLDDTRQQMRQMQEAFAVHEADWNVERDKLTRQLQTANDSLETCEENCKKIESAKFDLVIANANLQEKLVKLQASAKVESGRVAKLESELGETRRELVDSQKLVFRVKSQKRQRLGQVEAEASQLESRCAELQQLNDELRQQLEEASCQGRSMGQLVAERDRLQQESSERLAQLTTLTAQLSALEQSERDATNSKLRLEATVEDTERRLAVRDAQLSELQLRISELVSSADEKDTLIYKLRSEKSNLDVQIADISSALEDAQTSLRDTTSSLNETRTSLDEVRISLDETRTKLAATEVRLNEAGDELEEARTNMAKERTGWEAAAAELCETRTNLDEANAELERVKDKMRGDNKLLEEAEEHHRKKTGELDEKIRLLQEAAEQWQATAENSSQVEKRLTSEVASQAEKESTSEVASQAEKELTSEMGSQAEKQVTCDVGSQSEQEPAVDAGRVANGGYCGDTFKSDTLAGLQSQLQMFTTDLEASHSLLEQSHADRQRLADDCCRLQDELRNSEATASDLRSLYSELQSSGGQLQQKLGGEDAVRCEPETPGLTAHQPQTDLNKMVKRLKARLKQELKAKSSLDEKVDVMKQKIEELRTNLSELESSMRDAPSPRHVADMQSRLEDVRCQLELQTEAKLAAEQQLADALQARREAETPDEVAAQDHLEGFQQPSPPADVDTNAPAAPESKQKIGLTKAKLRKELQLKAALQKELSGLKERLKSTDGSLQESRKALAEEMNRSVQLASHTEAELGELRGQLTAVEAEVATVRQEKETLLAELREFAHPVAGPPSAFCQELLEQVAELQEQRQDSDELTVATERLQQEASSLLPTEQAAVLTMLCRLLATAVHEQHRAMPTDPFQLPLLGAADRSSSQSSLMSERSESARSEPPAADSEKDALLLKQQTRLRQLMAAVRRRTEMRDEALSKVRALEEVVDTLKARVQQAETHADAQERLMAELEEKDSRIAALLEEAVTGTAEKEKCQVELTEKDVRIDGLLHAVDEKEVARGKFEAALSEQEIRIADLSRDIESKASNIEVLEAVLTDKDAGLAESNSVVSCLRGEIAEVKSALSAVTDPCTATQNPYSSSQPATLSTIGDPAAELLSALADPAPTMDSEQLQLVPDSPGAVDMPLLDDVRSLMRQLRALPAGEASALFSGALDVVSLPSSGSDSQPRDSSEDNWSVVDERQWSGAGTPPIAAVFAINAAAAKDASPPSESSEAVTVVSAAPPASAGCQWQGDWVVEEQPAPGPVSLTMTAADGWRWSTDEEDPDAAATGLPSGQWGWDEDAGWPRDDHPPSEALQLGNIELVSEHVLGRDDAEQPAATVAAGSLVNELSTVHEQLTSMRREVGALQEERVQLLQQLDLQLRTPGGPADSTRVGLKEGSESEGPGYETKKPTKPGIDADVDAPEFSTQDAIMEAEKTAKLEVEAEMEKAKAALQCQIETTAQLQKQLEAASAESARLRHQVALVGAEREGAERRLEEQRIDANHQWSALNFENSSVKSDLVGTEKDLMELQTKCDTMDQERAELTDGLRQSQQQLAQAEAALRTECAARDAFSLEAEQERHRLDARAHATETARVSAVRLVEKSLAELKASAAVVEHLEGEVLALRTTAVHSSTEAETSGSLACRADLQKQVVERQWSEHSLASAGDRQDVGSGHQQDFVGMADAPGESAVEFDVPPVSHGVTESDQIPPYSSGSSAQYQQQHLDPTGSSTKLEVSSYFSQVKNQSTGLFGQDEQHSQVSSGDDQAQASSYLGQDQPGICMYIGRDQHEAGLYLDTDQPETDPYGNQEQHRTNSYFDQHSHAGSYFDERHQDSGSHFVQDQPQMVATFGQAQQHTEGTVDHVAEGHQPEDKRSDAIPVVGLCSASTPYSASLFQHVSVSTHTAVDAFSSQPASLAGPSAAEDPAPSVPVFTMLGSTSADVSQLSQTLMTDVSTVPTWLTADATAPGWQRTEPHGLPIEPDGQQARHQPWMDSCQPDQLQQRLQQALQDSQQLQQQLEDALQERQQLQLRLGGPEAVTNSQELEAALRERDELRLRVSDLEPVTEYLHAAVAERQLVETELDEARRQLATAQRRRDEADHDARHQLTMQLLESETKLEQRELRLADLEPVVQQRDSLQAQLAGAERAQMQCRLQLEQVENERAWLKLSMADLTAQLAAVSPKPVEDQELHNASHVSPVLATSIEAAVAENASHAFSATPVEEQVPQSVSHAFSAPAPAAGSLMFASSLFSAQPAGSSSDLLDSFGILSANSPPAPAVGNMPNLAEDIAEQVSLLRHENEQLRAHIDHLETVSALSATAEQRLIALQAEYEAQAAQLATLASTEERLTALQAEHETSAAQLAILASAEERLTALQADYDSQAARLATLASTEERLTTLQAEYEAQASRLATLVSAEDRVSDLEAEHEAQSDRLAMLSSTDERFTVLQAEYEAQAARLVTLDYKEEQIMNLQSECKIMRAQLATSTSKEQLQNACMETVQLRPQVATVDSWSERAAQLQQGNNELTAKLAASEDLKCEEGSSPGNPSLLVQEKNQQTLEKEYGAVPIAEEVLLQNPAAQELAGSDGLVTSLRVGKAAAEAQLETVRNELESVRAELETVNSQLQQYVDYYNYYAAYHSQSQGMQQYDQGQQHYDQSGQQALFDPTHNQGDDTSTETVSWADGACISSQSQPQQQSWSLPFESAGPVAVPSLETADRAGGNSCQLTTVSLFSPVPTDDASAAFDLTIQPPSPPPQEMTAVAETVVFAAQSVIPSVLSLFSGGGEAAPSPTDPHLDALRAENERLRSRVSALERAAATGHPAPDPLVALTSSPFLEEAGSPPLDSHWGWEEFSPVLEAAPHAADELLRVTGELVAERERAGRLEQEATALRQRAAAADVDKAAAAAQLTSDLQTERVDQAEAATSAAADGEQVARLTAELETERRRAADEAASLQQAVASGAGQLASVTAKLNARRDEVTRLQEDIGGLRDMTALLSSQLDAERARDMTALLSSELDAERARDMTALLSSELDAERARDMTALLSSELDAERARDMTALLSSELDTEPARDMTALLSSELDAEPARDMTALLSSELDAERARDMTALLSSQLDAERARDMTALLSSELDAERARTDRLSPPTTEDVAQLTEQLTEELAMVTQLTGELETERADVVRLQGEVQTLRDLLQDTEAQLWAARAAPTVTDSVLSDQAAFYRQKVVELETALAAAKQEVQHAKVKSGRLLQKLKLLQKGAQGPPPGADALDAAMLEELQSQVEEANRRAAEAERASGQLQQENVRLSDQIATYQGGQEANRRAAEAERASSQLQQENVRLSDQIATYQGGQEANRRAAEAERASSQLQQENVRLSDQIATYQGGQERLIDAIEYLEKQVHALRVQNERLRSQLSDMEWRLAEFEEAAEERTATHLADGPADEPAGGPADGSAAKSADTVPAVELTLMVQQRAALELRLTELELRNEQLLEFYQAPAAKPDDQLHRSVEQLQLALDAAADENAALTQRLAAYDAQSVTGRYAAEIQAAPHLTGADPAKPLVMSGTVPSLSQLARTAAQPSLTGANSVIPSFTGADHAATHLTGADPAAPIMECSTPLDEDRSLLLRSREAIIHSMADEISGLRATNAALLAESAQWRTFAEEGEDGDVLDGLKEQLSQQAEALHRREERCRYLTSDVAQLLEERDLLQLRLSSSLRLNQAHQLTDAASSASQMADVQQLKLKLAELKQLNYVLDIQLQGEVAERRRLQMSLQGGGLRQMSPNTSELINSPMKNI